MPPARSCRTRCISTMPPAGSLQEWCASATRPALCLRISKALLLRRPPLLPGETWRSPPQRAMHFLLRSSRKSATRTPSCRLRGILRGRFFYARVNVHPIPGAAARLRSSLQHTNRLRRSLSQSRLLPTKLLNPA